MTVCQVGTICTGLSLLVFSGVAFVTLIQGNLDNWANYTFFTGGFHGVISGSSILGHLVISWCTMSTIAGEVIKYQRISPILNFVIPSIVLLLLFPLGAGITLNAKYLSESAYLLPLLPNDRFYWFLIIVCIAIMVCLLCCIMFTLIISSRLLNCLSRDNLTLSCFGKVSTERGIPQLAVLFCGSVAAVVSATFSTSFLVRITGTGAFASGIAGSLAVICRRYHPDVFHCLDLGPSKETTWPDVQMIINGKPRKRSIFDSTSAEEDELHDEEREKSLSVFWNRGKWISNIINPKLPPSISTAKTTSFLLVTFLTNSMVGAAVSRYGTYLGIWWSIGIAFLCVGGCLVSAVGVWMQPRSVPSHFFYNAPGMPFIPLFSILVNTFLLFYLHSYALFSGVMVSIISVVIWLVRGYRNSIEAILSRALLSGNDAL